jgi:hypothetical protein
MVHVHGHDGMVHHRSVTIDLSILHSSSLNCHVGWYRLIVDRLHLYVASVPRFQCPSVGYARVSPCAQLREFLICTAELCHPAKLIVILEEVERGWKVFKNCRNDFLRIVP